MEGDIGAGNANNDGNNANSTAEASSSLPTHIGDYEVLKFLGRGKFAVVYRARKVGSEEIVALKRISVDMMNEKAREKCLKEVRLLQSLDHPNIIRYMDSFIVGNDLIIVYEFAAAGDLKRQLRKAIEKGIQFEERLIWKYFSQIANAMQHMHEKRIMHRDLKPANIFLTLEGVIKVGDLGLSRAMSEHTVQAHSKVGTPLYMSPEVLKGEGYDFKSDIWSLGCLLYELAMLKSPFKAEGLNYYTLFNKILAGDYPPIPTDTLSPTLISLCTRMISTTPLDRPDIGEVCRIANEMRIVTSRRGSNSENKASAPSQAPVHMRQPDDNAEAQPPQRSRSREKSREKSRGDMKSDDLAAPTHTNDSNPPPPLTPTTGAMRDAASRGGGRAASPAEAKDGKEGVEVGGMNLEDFLRRGLEPEGPAAQTTPRKDSSKVLSAASASPSRPRAGSGDNPFRGTSLPANPSTTANPANPANTTSTTSTTSSTSSTSVAASVYTPSMGAHGPSSSGHLYPLAKQTSGSGIASGAGNAAGSGKYYRSKSTPPVRPTSNTSNTSSSALRDADALEDEHTQAIQHTRSQSAGKSRPTSGVLSVPFAAHTAPMTNSKVQEAWEGPDVSAALPLMESVHGKLQRLDYAACLAQCADSVGGEGVAEGVILPFHFALDLRKGLGGGGLGGRSVPLQFSQFVCLACALCQAHVLPRPPAGISTKDLQEALGGLQSGVGLGMAPVSLARNLLKLLQVLEGAVAGAAGDWAGERGEELRSLSPPNLTPGHGYGVCLALSFLCDVCLLCVGAPAPMRYPSYEAQGGPGDSDKDGDEEDEEVEEEDWDHGGVEGRRGRGSGGREEGDGDGDAEGDAEDSMALSHAPLLPLHSNHTISPEEWQMETLRVAPLLPPALPPPHSLSAHLSLLQAFARSKDKPKNSSSSHATSGVERGGEVVALLGALAKATREELERVKGGEGVLSKRGQGPEMSDKYREIMQEKLRLESALAAMRERVTSLRLEEEEVCQGVEALAEQLRKDQGQGDGPAGVSPVVLRKQAVARLKSDILDMDMRLGVCMWELGRVRKERLWGRGNRGRGHRRKGGKKRRDAEDEDEEGEST